MGLLVKLRFDQDGFYSRAIVLHDSKLESEEVQGRYRADARMIEYDPEGALAWRSHTWAGDGERLAVLAYLPKQPATGIVGEWTYQSLLELGTGERTVIDRRVLTLDTDGRLELRSTEMFSGLWMWHGTWRHADTPDRILIRIGDQVKDEELVLLGGALTPVVDLYERVE
jgi:hypothetical protein